MSKPRALALWALHQGVSLVLPLGLLLSASSAPAWVGFGSLWPNGRVSYVVHGGSALELGEGRVEGVIAAAYDSWTSPECSAFEADHLGRLDEHYEVGDGLITHQWFYDPNQRPEGLESRSTIGVTVIVYRNEELLDGDILYNGIDHRWVEGETRPGEVDAQAIITHEVGHQLGLDHSSSRRATMYFAYSGGTEQRSLEPDDLDGLCSLYPSGEPLSCGPFPPCGAGERCVDERCEAIPEPPIGGPCPCEGEDLCVQFPEGEPFCTRRCDNGRCPPRWRCERVNLDRADNQVSLCLPFEPAPAAEPRGFGADCDGSRDCESGLCITDQLGRGRCSAYCRSFEDCPEQERCVPISDGGRACVPGSRDPGAPSPTVTPEPEPTPPGEGVSGVPCEEDADCVGLLCLSENGRGFCSELCEEDEDCPEPHVCLPIDSGNSGCWFPPYQPPALAPEGAPCAEAAQCASGFCALGESRCRTPCDGDEDCASGERCTEALPEHICSPIPPPDRAPPPARPVDQGALASSEEPERRGCGSASAPHQRPLIFLLFSVFLAAARSPARRRALEGRRDG